MNERKSVSLESAVKLCCEKTGPGDIEKIRVDQAALRVCAQNIFSSINIPGFKRSMVDGYAINVHDLGKSENLDINKLQVVAKIPAGSFSEITLQEGQCARIMTGAILPGQTAAAVKQEDTIYKGETIILKKKIKQNENIQFPGSIIKKGQEIISMGQVLDPGKIEKLSSAGIVTVPVYRQPRVYIINTGSETTLPGNPLEKGKIYQSNQSLLLSKISCAGCQALHGGGVVEDDISHISEEIKEGIKRADIIIITGGTSNGDYDLVLPALKNINTELIFTSIEIRPGRNVTVAVKNGKLIFNLPGNPGAVNILLDVLIAPAFKKIKGIKEYENKWINIRLSNSVPEIISQRSLLRAELIEQGAEFMAKPLRKKENFNGIKSMILDLQPGQGREREIVRGLIL